MMEFIGKWQFWVSVVLVSFIAHWAMSRFMPSMGG